MAEKSKLPPRVKSASQAKKSEAESGGSTPASAASRQPAQFVRLAKKERPTKNAPQQKRCYRKPSPKQAARSLRTSERTARAVELRRKGLSFRAIGKALGCDARTAQRRVDAALDEIRQETAEHADRLVEIELIRFDRMVEKLERLLNSRDPETVARAVRELIRVSARRARLLGLDAPERAEVSGPQGAPVTLGGQVVIMPAKEQ